MSKYVFLALLVTSFVSHAAATNTTANYNATETSAPFTTPTPPPSCGDNCMNVENMHVKVIGQSGKIDLAPDADVSGHPDRIRVEISALRELDTSGDVITGGSNKHSFNSFATQSFEFGDLKVDEYEGLGVVTVPFSSTLDTGSQIDIMMYIFTEGGEITAGGEQFEVSKGTFKFNVELSNWAWCGNDGVECKKGQTQLVGDSLELDISVSSQYDASRIDGSNSYDLGNGAVMRVSDQIKLDDGDWETMPNSGPTVEMKGKTMTFTLYFPKFTNTAVYDPDITYETDENVGNGGGNDDGNTGDDGNGGGNDDGTTGDDGNGGGDGNNGDDGNGDGDADIGDDDGNSTGVDPDDTDNSNGDNSTTVPESTASPDAPTTKVPMVTMVVELPYAKADFVGDVQEKFKAGVAKAAGTEKDKVIINKVTEKTAGRRLLLATSIDVDFSVQTASEAEAKALLDSEKLSMENLNTALEAEGVAKITRISEAAVVEVPEDVDSAGWVAQVPSMLVLAAAACLQIAAH